MEVVMEEVGERGSSSSSGGGQGGEGMDVVMA